MSMKISYVRNFAVVALVSFALTGCFDDTKETGPVQTVDWYKTHDNERQETFVVVKCFWPPNFEHSSSSFLLHSAAVHHYACAA